MTTTVPRPTREAVLATRDAWRLRFANLVRQRMEAKQTFADVTRAYQEAYPDDAVTAEFKAAGDPRLQQAIADAAWFENERLEAEAVIARLDRALGGAR